MKREKTNTKLIMHNANGITLMALVLTIVVMLILTGVAVSSSLNSEGIFAQANKSAMEWDESKTKEEDRVGEIFSDIKFPTIKFIEIPNPVDIKNKEKSLVDYYGYTVHTDSFSSVEGIDWQLFYDDDKNIYLISSDYVPIDTLPNELIKEPQAEGETKYRAYFATQNSNQYIGTIMDSEPWCNGTASTTITNNPLTAKYLKWALRPDNLNNTNPNAKATAYMMDTTRWANFAGNRIEGAFAIGGPTIELFVKSYNTKNDDKLTEYGEVNSQNSSIYGYYWKHESDATWLKFKLQALGLYSKGEKTIWSIDNSNNRAPAMWLASPCAYYDVTSANYMHVTSSYAYNGDSDVAQGTPSYKGSGFRPLVVLPKSSL